MKGCRPYKVDFHQMWSLVSDMEKGLDMRTLSAEIFENIGNFCISDDYCQNPNSTTTQLNLT